jgi:hypothetical protein
MTCSASSISGAAFAAALVLIAVCLSEQLGAQARN